LKTSNPEFIDEDIWKSYQFTGEETSTSELINRGFTGMDLYAEKVSATARVTIVYEVIIYEIRVVLSRVSPGQIMMHDHDEDNRSAISV
jgi:hypothetical protein